MTTLRLRLLGAPCIWRDEQPIRFKTRKTLAVLIYVVLEGGVASREQLAELLWPDQNLADARKNLRTTLSYVHLALGNGAVTTTHAAISLNHAAPIALDVDLEVLARAQRLAHADDAPDVDVLRAQLEQAVALYRGPFLAGLDIPGVPEFETWLAGQRAHWAGMAGELLERLAGLQATAGDLGAARGTVERWAALEPGEEHAWQRLLALALEAGDLVGARRGWAACQEALADLGVTAGAALQALARQIDATAQLARSWPSPVTCQEGACGGELGQAPLVGRTRQMATLRRAFARAHAGQAQLVVLHGEAGIGKTRLANEFLAWARAQGADAVVGRAFKVEEHLPYAPLVAGLRARLERENAPDDLLSDLWLAELARLLPELRERYPDLAWASEDMTLGRGRLYQAVAQLGQALAARSPLVVVLDDAQWLDAASRDLMRYLLRHWAENGARILVLLALRVDGSTQQQLVDQWLRELECETATTWIDLERLSVEEVLRLVTPLTGDAPAGEHPDICAEQVTTFGRWLADTCAGVPYLVIRMLEALLKDGAIRLCPAAGGDWALDVGNVVHAIHTQGAALLPAAIRTLVTAQVAYLDETAAMLLAAGTVLGDSFSAEHVLQVAGIEACSGEGALDRLVRGKLLCEVPETGTYSMGHPLVREVLYAELGVARRRRLHRRALAVLEAVGAPARELQRHALAAGVETRVTPAATTRAVPEVPTRRRAGDALARSGVISLADLARERKPALRAIGAARACDADQENARFAIQPATYQHPWLDHVPASDAPPSHAAPPAPWHYPLAHTFQYGAAGAAIFMCQEQRGRSRAGSIVPGELRLSSLPRPPP